MDIEDMVKAGADKIVCPYFWSREWAQDAELVLVPYNYLIDKRTRDSLNLSLENSIIIFDEAHNIESFACDAASFDLSALDIARGMYVCMVEACGR
jgi:regulator of telomere elongation helicase 1